MPDRRVPGRSFVTRRAIVDIVRPAVSGSYGVLGFAEPNIWKRILRSLGASESGIRVSLGDGIAIDLHLTVAYGLPIAEVARQADSAVRYAIRRSLGREVARLTIHVGGLRFQAAPPTLAGFEDAQRAHDRHVGDATSPGAAAATAVAVDARSVPDDRPARPASGVSRAVSPLEPRPSSNGRADHRGNGTGAVRRRTRRDAPIDARPDSEGVDASADGGGVVLGTGEADAHGTSDAGGLGPGASDGHGTSDAGRDASIADPSA